MQATTHVYEVRARKDKRGVDLISDALPLVSCGMLGEANATSNAIDCVKLFSRSHCEDGSKGLDKGKD